MLKVALSLNGGPLMIMELPFMKPPTIFYRSNVFQTTGVLYLVTLQSLVSDFSPFYLTLSSFFSTTFSIGKKILNAKGQLI